MLRRDPAPTQPLPSFVEPLPTPQYGPTIEAAEALSSSASTTTAQNEQKTGDEIKGADKSGVGSTLASGVAGGLEVAKDYTKISPARNPTTGLPMSGHNVTQPFQKVGNIASKASTALAIFTTGSEVKSILKENGSGGNKALKITATASINTLTFIGAGSVVAASSPTGPGVALGFGGAVVIGGAGEKVKEDVHNFIDRSVP